MKSSRATAKNPLDRYSDVECMVAVAAELPEPENPYKGLRAFGEADAADFFGREALTQQLLARMAEGGDLARFLAVVGPSGGGKSLVVKAGLIPALRAQTCGVAHAIPAPHLPLAQPGWPGPHPRGES